jgi:hypothetical protein
MTIRNRLLLLCALFAGSLVAVCFLAWTTLADLRVKGPIYHQIVDQKDLLADAAPPPLFMVEVYALAHEIDESADAAAVNAQIGHREGHRTEFTDAMARWKKEVAGRPLRRRCRVDRSGRPPRSSTQPAGRPPTRVRATRRPADERPTTATATPWTPWCWR